MTARPWMPLYVADYLADTAHLDATASGVYLHLIMHYWQNGSLPDDDAQLARIGKISPYNWKKLRQTIQKFFYDGWKHKRIEEELANAGEISEKRRKAANARHGNKDANAPANAVQMHTQSQSQSQSQSQRKDKKEESSLRSARPASDWPADAFDQFWRRYPHKVGQPAALKAFRSAERRNREHFDVVMAGLQRYIAGKPPDRPWCNPATWLNQERWADQPAVLPASRSPPRAAQNGFAAIAARFAEQDQQHAGGVNQDRTHDQHGTHEPELFAPGDPIPFAVPDPARSRHR